MIGATKTRFRRGVTLIEVAIGTLLVGGVLAVTLQVVGPAARGSLLAGDKAVAATLADGLLDEISVLPFEDPTDSDGTITLEAGETSGLRSSYDDVDDFNNWFSAPTLPDGTVIETYKSDWRLACIVTFVDSVDLNSTRSSDTGLKKVRVIASKNGVALADRSVLRSDQFDLAMEEK